MVWLIWKTGNIFVPGKNQTLIFSHLTSNLITTLPELNQRFRTEGRIIADGSKLSGAPVDVWRELDSTLSTGKMRAKQRPCFEQSRCLNLKVKWSKKYLTLEVKFQPSKYITSHKTWILKYAVLRH